MNNNLFSGRILFEEETLLQCKQQEELKKRVRGLLYRE
jgi:hypothetical protein